MKKGICVECKLPLTNPEATGYHPFCADSQSQAELLEKIDNKLRELEDIAHGEIGEKITEIRGMIQKAQKE